MAFDTINIGAAPNDGTGDTLRTGGGKINDNFAKAVEGPASATAAAVAAFDGTTGKLLQNGQSLQVTAGKFSPTANTAAGNGMYLADTNTLAFSTNGTEKVRVTSGGNLGVGTDSPQVRLHVGDGTQTAINGANLRTFIANQTVGQRAALVTLASATGPVTVEGQFESDGGATPRVIIGSSSNHPVEFRTNNAERMRITSAGLVLVNATSSLGNAQFYVEGNRTVDQQPIVSIRNTATSGGDGSAPLNCYKSMTTTSSAARFIQFFAADGGVPMGGIVGNGASNVQFATISDAREKTNITSISGSLEKVLALKPVEFDWIANGEHCPAGFVAQDVEQVFPEFVVENMANDGEEFRKGLTGGITGGFVAHLVKAIQELKAEVDELKAKLEEQSDD